MEGSIGGSSGPLNGDRLVRRRGEVLEQWSPAHHHYCMLISGASLSVPPVQGEGGAGGLWGVGGVDGGAAVTSCSGRRPAGPGGGTSPLLQASGVILREPLMCNLKKKKEAAKGRRKLHRHSCAVSLKVETVNL